MRSGSERCEISAPRATVLVVEDHAEMRKLLGHVLGLEPFDVVMGVDASSGIELFRSDAPDVVLLDLALPDGSGMRVLDHVREDGSDTPVIILSALTDEATLVAALDAGACDYIRKPFRPRELVARIHSQLRAAPGPPRDQVALGDVRLDRTARKVDIEGVHVHLTTTEFDLLAMLLDHRGRAVARGQLLDQVWGPGYPRPSKALDVHIRRLRSKVERPGRLAIETVRGYGYRIGSRAEVETP